MIVVKVGGSLYDHPKLGPGLRDYLDTLAPSPVLLVPGGGVVADAVRRLDALHQLGEEAAHWVALRSLAATGEFLDRLVGTLASVREGEPPAGSPCDPLLPSRLNDSWVRVLDCHAFAVADERNADHLPHTWDVTTDSIAARAAVVYGADRLVLLKSTELPPETDWEAAAGQGLVDPHFPKVIAGTDLRVEIVNFRRRLDAV